ncbi:uncharacterized protein [Montipora foliosa]|uniref:uncharacterized protein isoform X2 n=1 Tax=Montipora foliosa TaxID=591990 RepID=UPI0035F19BD1
MDFKIVSFLSVLSTFEVLVVSGLPTKPLKIVPVRQGQNITLPCTALSRKALEVEKGRFLYVRWYMWAYNGVKAQWVFLAGMKENGDVKVERDLYKGFNISRDGGLYIREAQPCHAQKFMCRVALWSKRTPVTRNVILRLTDENENRPTEKPEPTEVRTTSESRNQENRPTEKPEPTEVRTTSESRNHENRPTEKPEPTEVRTTSESRNHENRPTEKPEPTEVRTTSESRNQVEIIDSHLGPFTATTTIAVIPVIVNVVMAFFLYLVRSHLKAVVCFHVLRYWQRLTGVQFETEPSLGSN